jgi:Holliday junction resolvase RusA-like endonuclease
VRTELLLPYPPSVNGLFATNKKTGGRFKSKPYKAWITAAGWTIRSQPDRGHEHRNPVKMTLLIRKPEDNHRRDLQNLVKAVEDLLVLHRILADDSLIEASDIRWVYEGLEGAKVIIEDLIES